MFLFLPGQCLHHQQPRELPDYLPFLVLYLAGTNVTPMQLLFLIVADSEFDGSTALEMFGQSEIADTDNDGLNEFIDAFGVPIKWIRCQRLPDWW